MKSNTENLDEIRQPDTHMQWAQT